MTDLMFENWLNEKHNGISNRERYQDILNSLKIAFDAGFRARLEYTAEEQLQK